MHRFAWECGKTMPESLLDKISPAELEYFKSYVDAIDTYNKSLSSLNNIDLTLDLAPPKDLFIEVRIKEDYGEI